MLECGCWTGAWWGITPPPRCDYHSGRTRVRNRDTGTWTEHSDYRITTTTPVDMSKYVGTYDLNAMLNACEKFIAACVIDCRPNPAAHDAWQLALECLEPLRAAIERARKASKP